MELNMKKCLICHHPIVKKPKESIKQFESKKYCSKSCSAKGFSGYKHSSEAKKIMSSKKKGSNPWNKGRTIKEIKSKFCKYCLKEFDQPKNVGPKAWSSRIYCSMSCSMRDRLENGVLKGFVPSTAWISGYTPWNKGIADQKCECRTCGKIFVKKKHQSKVFCSLSCSKIGENNSHWSGDSVEYRGIHQFISSRLGKPTKCEMCGQHFSGRKIHWANKDHKYSRNYADWIRLCSQCHGAFDSGMRKGSICQHNL